ncbi:hypothetical protein [Bacillus manliponensis]|uniref:hypothetical protein n=1 Tax=Bacillus manliponensis TaxID=574376 RepID=UPI003518E38A
MTESKAITNRELAKKMARLRADGNSVQDMCKALRVSPRRYYEIINDSETAEIYNIEYKKHMPTDLSEAIENIRNTLIKKATSSSVDIRTLELFTKYFNVEKLTKESNQFNIRTWINQHTELSRALLDVELIRLVGNHSRERESLYRLGRTFYEAVNSNNKDTNDEAAMKELDNEIHQLLGKNDTEEQGEETHD